MARISRKTFLRALAGALAGVGGWMIVRGVDDILETHRKAPRSPDLQAAQRAPHDEGADGHVKPRALPDRKATIRAVFARDARPPRLSPQHLTLMRQLRVIWLPIEEGAPGLDIWHPLRGPRPTIAAAMSTLKTDNEAFAVQTLAELGLLVPAILKGAAPLGPGRYAVPPDARPLFEFPHSGVDATGRFHLRKEHLILLKAAQWLVVDSDSISDVLDGEAECWPMPFVDGKRPYGNRSHYQLDMAELLGEPYRIDRSGNVVEDARKDARLERLHGETLAALQVVLAHGAPAIATL